RPLRRGAVETEDDLGLLIFRINHHDLGRGLAAESGRQFRYTRKTQRFAGGGVRDKTIELGLRIGAGKIQGRYGTPQSVGFNPPAQGLRRVETKYLTRYQ